MTQNNTAAPTASLALLVFGLALAACPGARHSALDSRADADGGTALDSEHTPGRATDDDDGESDGANPPADEQPVSLFFRNKSDLYEVTSTVAVGSAAGRVSFDLPAACRDGDDVLLSGGCRYSSYSSSAVLSGYPANATNTSNPAEWRCKGGWGSGAPVDVIVTAVCLAVP